MNGKKACFFSHEALESLKQEQYSMQDINILEDLGYSVTIANNFGDIPWNYDLYFAWWASGGILPLIKARISRKPIITVAGGNEAMICYDSLYKTPIGYKASPFYKKLATRFTLRFSSKVLCVSDFMLSDVKRLGAPEPEVVYNSVDINKFHKLNITPKYILSIFRTEKKTVKLKRGDVFIKSISYVLDSFPHEQFVIIGEKGDDFRRLKNLAKRHGIENNLSFIGSINNNEVIRWLNESKVYVQISDTETFGMAIAEAMSCQVPVVVSSKGAIPEIVGDNGLFVDHNDHVSVARGIISILNKKDNEIEKIGRASRKRIIDQFSYEIRKEKIKRIIDDLNNSVI